MSSSFWKSEGKLYHFSQLTDDHFMNIVADGYRSEGILIEAKKRGIFIPIREVDCMTDFQLNDLETKILLAWRKKAGVTFGDVVKKRVYFNKLKEKSYDTYLLILHKILVNRDEKMRDLCID